MKIVEQCSITTRDKKHIKLENSGDGLTMTVFDGDKVATVVLTRPERQALAKRLYR